jgi:hypothetical protein
MLVAYLKAALQHAKAKILEENQSVYGGEIPALQGVYAHLTGGTHYF